MSVTLIQDLRWGDTGKGKISEYMSQPDRCDVSVRAVGGGNAGHVIKVGTRKLALHILPAGCIHEGVDLVLGRGMVTHLPTLFDDVENTENIFGADPLSRLVIARENHILLNGHKAADAALEERKGKDAVGTTKSGIGPAYADKALRVGMRMEELQKPIEAVKDRYNGLLRHWSATYGVQLESEQQDRDIVSLLAGKALLEDKIQDLTAYWREKFEKDVRVTIEGAQGSLLSIDHCGYPYVTSSATTTSGHLQGAAIPTRELKNVIGTLKAYDTRVGNGPMRTEMDLETGTRIQQRGGEFGSTTGRPRRVGWLDLEDTRRHVWAESVTSLAVLKGDVLDEESEIPVANGTLNDQPLYMSLPGWVRHGGIRGMKHSDDLHPEARNFYNYIGEYLRTPVAFIGTGPESDALIDRRDEMKHLWMR